MSSPQRTLQKRPLPGLAMTTGTLLRRNTDVKKNTSTVLWHHVDKPVVGVEARDKEHVATDFLKQHSLFLHDYVRTHCDLSEVTQWLSERQIAGSPPSRLSYVTDPGNSSRYSVECSVPLITEVPWSLKNRREDLMDDSDDGNVQVVTMKKSMAIIQSARDWRNLDDRIGILTYLRECLSLDGHAQKLMIYVRGESHRKRLIPLNLDSLSLDEENYISMEESARPLPVSVAAITGTTLRIKDIAIDDRFPAVQHYFRANIQSVLACPLVNDKDESIGAVELHRSLGKPPFSHDDEEKAIGFCTWASVALTYTDLCREALVQQKVYDFILHVTKVLFSKVDNLVLVMKETLMAAKSLVHAKYAVMYEVDQTNHEYFCRVHENEESGEMEWIDDELLERFPMQTGIPGRCSLSQESELIQNARQDEKFCKVLYEGLYSERVESMLCSPVVINGETVGVIQLINHQEGYFTPQHLKHLKIFEIYCALAFKAAKMYETIQKSEQTLKVALEVLSYHTKLNDDEYRMLEMQEIPSSVHGLRRLNFEQSSLKGMTKMTYIVFMFKDLFMKSRQHNLHGLRFDQASILKFILTMRKCHVNTPHHNWHHTFNVIQAVYTFLTRFTVNDFTIEEEIAMFLSALGHEADYPTGEPYAASGNSPFSTLYSTPMIEMRHFHAIATALKNNDTNILQKLPTARFKTILDCLTTTLQATNVNQFLRNRNKLEFHINTPGCHSIILDDVELRMARLGVCMMSCDLCQFYKSWEIHFGDVLMEMNDYWYLSEEEKSSYGSVTILYRENFEELPDCMVKFISQVVSPAFHLTSRMIPKYVITLEKLRQIHSRWESLANLDTDTRLRHLRKLEEKQQI